MEHSRERSCRSGNYRPPAMIRESGTLRCIRPLICLITLFILGATPTYAAGFITAPAYAAGINPGSVAVGDFNGDGIPDLAVLNEGNHSTGTDSAVSILLGNGDGTFQAPKSFVVSQDVSSMVVGDFNGDGHLDLAVAHGYSSDRVSILLGNGDGTFRAGQSYATDDNTRFLAMGDFNGDGFLDIAVASAGAYPDFKGTISLLLGNGDGTFQAVPQNVAVSQPTSMVVGDFNGDGNLDLAVSNGTETDSGTVIILLGNGDGTFQAGQSYAVNSSAGPMAVGDFNEDGIPDLAVASYAGKLTILLGNGDGTFHSNGVSYTPSYLPQSLAVGDFNRDGHLDVVIANSTGLSIFLGLGDGTFQAPLTYAGYGPDVYHFMATGDFNGDGVLDVALSNYFDNTVSILIGKGDGTFHAARNYPPGGALAVGDFNGDGIADLIVTTLEQPMRVLLGKGDGTFQAGATSPGGEYPRSVALGDFNGDGKLDIVTANFLAVPSGRPPKPVIVENDVRVFLGNGDGSFQAGQIYTPGLAVNSVAVGDFNGDGIPDLAVASSDFDQPDRAAVSILLGNGDGTFQAAQDYAAFSAHSIVVNDFNGDGIQDLAVAEFRSGSGSVSVMLGNGDGTFQAAQSTPASLNLGYITSLAVGDFNGDGIQDLALITGALDANNRQYTLTVMLGNGDGTFQAPQWSAALVGGEAIAVADFNRDGFLDLAVADDSGVSILMGNGDGTFTPITLLEGVGGVAVGDFNGDGYPDLVASGFVRGSVTVLLNSP